MEESLEPTPFGVSGNSQDQDWSQWMQWDWDEAGSNAISKSEIDISDQSPGQHNLPTDFAPVSLPAGTNLISQPEGPLFQQASWARRRTGSAKTKKLAANNVSGQKRKTSMEDDDGSVGADDDSPTEVKPQPPKKRSHNVIEKRYRANLNDKITELRDSVPSLRVLTRENNGGGSAHDDDAATGNKLNKASILSKATEYIRHLELRNTRLEEENKGLKIRLRELDKAVIIEQSASTSVGSASSPDSYSGTIDSLESPPSVFSHTDDLTHSRKGSGPSHPPEGLLKVPDYIKKLRATAPTQGAFAESYIKDEPKPQQYDGDVRRGMTPRSKLFLGTLAGLMVVQNITTKEASDESDEKGLLAVPMNMLRDFLATHFKTMWTSFLLWGENSGLWRAWQVRAILNVFLTAVLVVGSAFFVFLYLFYARPRSQDDTQKVSSAAGVKMTPAELKRQAWLTSMQRLGVPRHRFFLEWFAVTCRWVEYTACCILGRKMYSRITGITEEDEKGRIKTWDIAIDAQLAGGDAEVSKSRLTLTIFASGTLPRNPERSMLKALHCRILLWRVGETDSFISQVANNVGRAVATYQWNIARDMNRRLPKDHPDALPSHLSALLELECNDVLLDPIVQRAVNLTWSRPTQEGLDEDEALLDVVADDPAVQTFADSIAAWSSSHLLQKALLHSFDVGSGVKKSLQRQIDLALKVAPRLSAAHTRAAAMRAVLSEQDRLLDIQSVLTALPSKKHQKSQVSNFLDSSLPMAVREEIAIAVRCAMIAAIIKARTTNDTTFPSHLTIRKAINWLNQLPLDPIELTLVSFAAVYHLLHTVVAYGDLLSSSSSASSPSATSSEFSVSTTKSAPPSLPKNNNNNNNASGPPSPCTSRRARSNSASEPTPQYSRIAGDLMYWARNAYNPAFYGLTTRMVDTVEAECISICKNVGIDVADHDPGAAIQSSIRKLIKEEQKQHARDSKRDDEDRRRSVVSNDTGYASDSR